MPSDVMDKDFECSVLVSTLTASSPTKPFLLSVCIQETPNPPHPFSTTGKAFVNSGAMGNFIHPCLVTQLQIPTTPHPIPLQLQTVTGQHFHEVTQQVQVTLITSHSHEEIITLDMAPIGKHNVILGLPWCTYHEVQFNWNQHNIIKWSPSCKGQCFYTPMVTPLFIQLMSEDAISPQ
jgi:hypothetical protein